MNAFTRRFAFLGVGIAALVGSLGVASPASAYPNAYDAGIWSINSPRTGRQLGKVGFKAPYCQSMSYDYGRILGVGGNTCYFGAVDVIENTSDNAIVYRWTDWQYRTKTAANNTAWITLKNTGAWSSVRCDTGPYSMCGNDTGASLCASQDAAYASTYGYYPCVSNGGFGGLTLWMNASGFSCGDHADHDLASLGCARPVDIRPGEELRTITHVYFYERSTNQWWYLSLVRPVS
jgi:hypothetical protein